jgi:putative endonuclease
MEAFETRSAAMSREHELKQLSREEKAELAAGSAGEPLPE